MTFDFRLDVFGQIAYNWGMSTQRIPFAFYGRYFNTRTEAEAFLATHGADYDSDSIEGEEHDVLGLQYLNEDVYILGFPLKAGESDARARAHWFERIDAGEAEAQSYFEINAF